MILLLSFEVSVFPVQPFKEITQILYYFKFVWLPIIDIQSFNPQVYEIIIIFSMSLKVTSA